MTDIVHVENLVKRYDDLIALDHFNLSIAPGEIFGLLGPNGSGKTTSINCILQLLAYDKGTIELFGEPMTPTRYDLKRRIGVVPQQVAVFDELTVRENIDYFCSLYVNDRKRRRALVDEAIDFVGLGDFTKFRPGKLSGGLARRLNIACGIAHKPELIFFDEPTVAAGLLHDTVEDTGTTIEEIDDKFGEDVADIVDGVTKISMIVFENKEEAQAENIRKMILAMSHDMRVLMVKLADRLHNMSTLDFQKPHKQRRIAQETMLYS